MTLIKFLKDVRPECTKDKVVEVEEYDDDIIYKIENGKECGVKKYYISKGLEGIVFEKMEDDKRTGNSSRR